MASELDSYTVLELKQILPMFGIKCSDISGSGKKGCILKKDIISVLLLFEEAPKKETNNKKISKKAPNKDESVNYVKEIDSILNNNVSIFDFVTYKKEFNYMKTYFNGLELYLRTALFIDYKYNHMSKKNRNVFETQIQEKPKKNRKKYIETVLNVFEPLYLITQWFRYFIPTRLIERPQYVFTIAEKYKHHIDAMFNRMYKARVDPEWDEEAKLWFS